MSNIAQIKSGLFHGLGFILMVCLSGIAYSAYIGISDVGDTDILTSSTFNNVLENQRVIKTTIDGLTVGVNPTGAVMAFNLDTCPTGWSEYTALQGKFIRGADVGTVNDPDFATRTGGTGARKIGSTQGDEFKSHAHGVKYKGGRLASLASGTHQGSINDVYTYRGGSETRPKNVYLLYCIKN